MLLQYKPLLMQRELEIEVVVWSGLEAAKGGKQRQRRIYPSALVVDYYKRGLFFGSF